MRVEHRHHHVGGRRRQGRRKHAPLAHHDQDPLEPQRKPAGRNALAEEHADQVVVAAAAAEAAGEVGHVDLHDRARVVRQPARQARSRTRCARRARESRVSATIARRFSMARPRRHDVGDVELAIGRSSTSSVRRLSKTSQSASPACCADAALAPAPSATPSRPILSSLSSATSAVPCSASRNAGGVQQRRQQLTVIEANHEVA